MPPSFLFDLSAIDLDAVAFDKEAIRVANMQRGDFEQLDAIIWTDPENRRMLGYKDVRDDEFWVGGHIPGRPLYPGVLMLEAAAQMASFYTFHYEDLPGFIGFGGVDSARFRMQVPPGKRIHLLLQKNFTRHRIVSCTVQGVVDGQMAFETTIMGTAM